MKTRQFSNEYKEEAVKLVAEAGVLVRQAAKDLGIGQSTLQKWVGQFKKANQVLAPIDLNQREELKRLQADNHKLRLERDLLKRASVFFATDRTT